MTERPLSVQFDPTARATKQEERNDEAPISTNTDHDADEIQRRAGHQSMTTFKMTNNSMFVRKPWEKDDYLGQLDEFMNDNLKTIADLIAIKKGMQGDVKAAKQAN